MAERMLPEDGELRLGPVTLPAGRRITSALSGDPVAWATIQDVPDAGRVWADLSAAHSQTGLVPFLLAGLDETTARPWESGEFDDPADVIQLDHMDAASLLKNLWDGKTHEGDEDEWGEDEDEDFVEAIEEQIAPFSRQFPGLAPAIGEQLEPGQLDDVLGSLPAARIGLVPAARPADVLPLIGWAGTTNWGPEFVLDVAAVLRSWEDRFGARLLEIGFAEIRLLVERLPRSVAAAQRIAAEHYAFCNECGGRGLSEVPSISPSLVNAPIWTFWWD
jgi:hypothetical protein